MTTGLTGVLVADDKLCLGEGNPGFSRSLMPGSRVAADIVHKWIAEDGDLRNLTKQQMADLKNMPQRFKDAVENLGIENCSHDHGQGISPFQKSRRFLCGYGETMDSS